jgi:O-antigen/teichoic acid export membrane protein
MSEGQSDLRRVLSSGGIYAIAGASQQALSFVLLPVYTRFIDPVDYGVLELLTALSAVLFGTLAIGIPSAIVKCYHRDCETPEEQAALLTMGLALAAPGLIGGALLLSLFAEDVSQLVLGLDTGATFVRLVAANGALSWLTAIVLSALRAQERALAFSTLSVTQVGTALLLNLTLVAYYDAGVTGIFWGNLCSNVLALPIGLLVTHRSTRWTLVGHLARPLARFGLLLVPVVVAGWAMNMSDRYVIRLFNDLSDVAVYGVGYKFGMIVEVMIVFPFQLAWPAISFSLSHREGHRTTYANALTYLVMVLAYLVIALTFSTRIGLEAVVGEAYRDAYRVVPLVALAYAFNGIQYCVAPGIHIAEKTRLLTLTTVAGAVLNLGLNFLLIPSWGMMGAAWATAGSFLLVAVVTGGIAQRFYHVDYDYRRLAKILGCALLVAAIGVQIPPESSLGSVAWHAMIAIVAFPAALLLSGFLGDAERDLLRDLWRRATHRTSG